MGVCSLLLCNSHHKVNLKHRLPISHFHKPKVSELGVTGSLPGVFGGAGWLLSHLGGTGRKVSPTPLRLFLVVAGLTAP